MSKNIIEKLVKGLTEEEEDEEKTPVRTVRSTKPVMDAVARYKKTVLPKVEEVKALLEEVRSLMRTMEEGKELLWSTVTVELGLSNERYEMRFNDKTNEIEILKDKYESDDES